MAGQPPVGAEVSLANQLAALLKGAVQQQPSGHDRASIGPGLTTLPRKLFDKMHQWEFIESAELLPQTSAHDTDTP